MWMIIVPAEKIIKMQTHQLENGSFDSRLLFYVTSKQLLLEIMTTTGFSDSYGPVNCKMNENTTNRHNHLTSEFHIFSYPGNKLI